MKLTYPKDKHWTFAGAFGKWSRDVYLDFLVVPSANVEEAGFMDYTAVSRQVALKTLWLHFRGEVMPSAV